MGMASLKYFFAAPTPLLYIHLVSPSSKITAYAGTHHGDFARTDPSPQMASLMFPYFSHFAVFFIFACVLEPEPVRLRVRLGCRVHA